MNDWTPDDAVRFRAFIAVTPNFLPKLRKSLPRATGKTTEEMAITGAKRAGGEELIERIEKLMLDQPKGDKAESIPES